MLSVVIPTCNRNELLSKCLDCLAPAVQTLDSAFYEVIITDDSKENVAKKLINDKFAWVKWVEGPKKGPAANRNHGAFQTIGDWLVFIDDDCLPDKNLLLNYKDSSLIDRNTLVFEGSINPDRLQRSFIEESPLNQDGGWLWSCNFMIKKDLFINDIGGFDENFPYAAMEDVDLHYRLKKKKLNIKFLKTASVIHPWREQKRMYSVTMKRFKSTLYFLQKHPEKSNEINCEYYLRVFYNSFIKGTLKNAIHYRFRGFLSKLIFDFMNLYFSMYLLFRVK